MYVDKQLSGIAAVQTLSRLNRTMAGKADTYVLDFVNDPSMIQAAFQEYYEDARVETSSDPDLVANQLNNLDAVGIFTWAEVDQVWADWTAVSRTPGAMHNALSAHLDPPIDRFKTRWLASADDEEECERLVDFRGTLVQYFTSYAFFSQVLHFGDPRYEEFSVFADLLGRRIRALDAGGSEMVDVSDIVLTHYKLEKLKEDIALAPGATEGLRGVTDAGIAKLREKERASTYELIEKVIDTSVIWPRKTRVRSARSKDC